MWGFTFFFSWWFTFFLVQLHFLLFYFLAAVSKLDYWFFYQSRVTFPKVFLWNLSCGGGKVTVLPSPLTVFQCILHIRALRRSLVRHSLALFHSGFPTFIWPWNFFAPKDQFPLLGIIPLPPHKTNYVSIVWMSYRSFLCMGLGLSHLTHCFTKYI